MASMNPPMSKAVVEVGDDLVKRYESAGWTTVKSASSSSKSTSKSTTSKAKK